MQIVIHRGTHQIGGVATEVRTSSTRIIIDMGSELSMEENYVPASLSVSGVTDTNGRCDAVLFTHNHGDHAGELMRIREGIPLYMGVLAWEILLAVTKDTDAMLKKRIMQVNTFTAGRPLVIGDMVITPYSVDHSACDSYMFLIEADGKRILHTGDFRMHGFRGKALPKMLDKLIGKVDVLITEGTMLSRDDDEPMTERALQQRARLYLKQYKYVFVYAATTNLERICALSKAVPRGKYFLCDTYQAKLLSLIEKHWGRYSPLYRNIKRTTYDDERMARFRKRGGMMMVRDNPM
ncbi:MAG: MBL fold metallo-hydrolase, partial [Selenomonadales bacterium]|nr:MBL fold metallo-hydrolase [Selenomonadales bacterium]